MRFLISFCSLSVPFFLFNTLRCQDLKLENIMRHPQWMGSQPSNPVFSADGKSLFFTWNPEKETAEPLWQYLIPEKKPARKLSYKPGRHELAAASGKRNRQTGELVFISDNALYLRNSKTGKESCLLKTEQNLQNATFLNADRISFFLNDQPFTLDTRSGFITQLLVFKDKKKRVETLSKQDSLLAATELKLFPSLQRRKNMQDFLKERNKSNKDSLLHYYTGDRPFSLFPSISPDGTRLAFQLKTEAKYSVANVPSYVNERGFTQEIPTREKVGNPEDSHELIILDVRSGKSFPLKAEHLPGIRRTPDFYKDYPRLLNRLPADRPFFAEDILWNEDGSLLLADVRSDDHKDRWLMLWSAAKETWTVADQQRDEAWIGGPAAEPGSFGFITGEDIWYLSETSGWTGLYRFSFNSGNKRTLYKGKSEVSNVVFLKEIQTFYFLGNPEDAGIHSIYRLKAEGGTPEKISPWPGGHQFVVSPDGRHIAFRYSTATRPWELFLMENKSGSSPVNLTPDATSAEFRALKLNEPEFIRIPAADGAAIPARLYKPEASVKNGAAVIFVHGAGYLQNAHRHWSHYFREFLFHQMLAREGFTVLDLDYRASAGYGRDWRTGIYRHMGGKDLSDQVDGAHYLSKKLGIDSSRIGIYGGSYGGFITLMALCTRPGVFRCGAALRSVTDWMHYNHGYTSNILNNPLDDSIAYRRSSPINFAPGLKGRLLMCHGMMDLNVHFQDIVRFSQRLIELGKENWELASYPLEDHAFVEPESWLDEYRRIHRLFREELLPKK